MTRAATLGVCAAILLFSRAASAHEVKPCYLELREIGDARFSVVWKTPLKGGAPLAVRPAFGPDCKLTRPRSAERVRGATIERWSIDCASTGVENVQVTLEGPDAAANETLVRIEWSDGATHSFLLRAGESTFFLPSRESASEIAWSYLVLGVEHILLGVDHLLFVFALLMIVSGKWKLVKAVTAFTIAHSITLSAAVLGFVSVPTAPVEAVIALSIVFLACELLRVRDGRQSLTASKPWVVSFSFGLLHGFGFAGALSSLGLPEQAIPLALALFNVGVELGQLAFVLVILALFKATPRISISSARRIRTPGTYAIGSVAAFWLIERVVGFWS